MGKKVSKNHLVIICCLMVALIIFLYTIILFYPQNNKHNNLIVTIKPGFTLGKISNLLYQKNIITNKYMFELAALAMGKEKEFPI